MNYFFWLLQVTAFPSLIIHYNLQIHSENLMFINEREIETKLKIRMTLWLFCSKHSKLNLISKRISVNVKTIQLMHLLSWYQWTCLIENGVIHSALRDFLFAVGGSGTLRRWKFQRIPEIYQGFWIKIFISKFLYLRDSCQFFRTFSEIWIMVFL